MGTPYIKIFLMSIPGAGAGAPGCDGPIELDRMTVPWDTAAGGVADGVLNADSNTSTHAG